MINQTTEKSTFTYACTSCGWKSHITTGLNNRVSFSNVQRHYTTQRCQKFRERRKPVLSSSTIADYYQTENNQTTPVNLNEVDFSSSTNENLDQTTSQKSKNLLPPAGIPENTEPSGR